MGFVFCFMFAFFGILLCTGCSISSSSSRRDTERRIKNGAQESFSQHQQFMKRFTMTDEEEYSFRQEIFSEAGIQYTYKTCKEFCKPIKECDVWFAELESFASMLIYDQRFVTTIIRIMAAETGRIAHFDSYGIKRDPPCVEDRRYYAIENKIIQLIDKKLMSCGCSPMLFTSYEYNYYHKNVKYVLKSVQGIQEFNDGVYIHGDFKWMDAGMYSGAETGYLEQHGGKVNL